MSGEYDPETLWLAVLATLGWVAISVGIYFGAIIFGLPETKAIGAVALFLGTVAGWKIGAELVARRR